MSCSSVNVTGDSQNLNGWPSSEHAALASGSSIEKVNVAVRSRVATAGPVVDGHDRRRRVAVLPLPDLRLEVDRALRADGADLELVHAELEAR